jgi:hypothetical protein
MYGWDSSGFQKYARPPNGSALRSGFCRYPCVKADIHSPVDRVLLRDCGPYAGAGLLLIREHGLKHRSGSPEALIRSMNKLCMEMTHTRKKTEKDETRGRGRSLIPFRQPPQRQRCAQKRRNPALFTGVATNPRQTAPRLFVSCQDSGRVF